MYATAAACISLTLSGLGGDLFEKISPIYANGYPISRSTLDNIDIFQKSS